MLAVGRELVYACVAIAIGDVQIPGAVERQVGYAIERISTVLHGSLALNVSGVGGLVLFAEGSEQGAVGREDANRVIEVVRRVDPIVGTNVDAVGIGEQSLAPRVEEVAVCVEKRSWGVPRD